MRTFFGELGRKWKEGHSSSYKQTTLKRPYSYMERKAEGRCNRKVREEPVFRRI
jgi:hypothetical protein